APVRRAVGPRVAGPPRFPPLLAPRARHARVDHRGGGALRPRPAVHLRRVSQPAAARDAARGGPDRELRVRPAPQAGVGEEPRRALVLQHLSARRAAAGSDRAARAREPRGGPLSGGCAVPLLRGAERRQAHLLRHVHRAPRRDPARQGNAARNARVAAAGSLALQTAALTATPAASAASPTSTRSFTISGTLRAPTGARARVSTSRGAASLRRTWIIVAPPASARRHASIGSRPLRSAASVITIKRNKASSAMSK